MPGLTLPDGGSQRGVPFYHYVDDDAICYDGKKPWNNASHEKFADRLVGNESIYYKGHARRYHRGKSS